jgi:hypothetical protein
MASLTRGGFGPVPAALACARCRSGARQREGCARTDARAVSVLGQDWDDGSVTLAQLNNQEARDRAHMQSLVVRGGQISEDTAANPEVSGEGGEGRESSAGGVGRESSEGRVGRESSEAGKGRRRAAQDA